MLTIASAVAGTPVMADDDIVIAVAGPMTGQYAHFGKAMQAAATAAVETINGRGGIAGRKVLLSVEDDGCDKAKTLTVARQLVARKVALVVGHHCASASIAAAPLYAAAGIVMISPGTTDPQFTDKRAGPTIFRLAPRDDAEGAISGAYIARHFAGKRVAILHDRTVVGIKLATDTKKAMNAAGLAEAMFAGFIAGERDYGQLARDMRAHRIDVIYLGAYPSEVEMIRGALARDTGSVTLVGSRLLSQAGTNFEGMLVTALALSSAEDPNGVGSSTRAAIEAWAQATGMAAVAPTLQSQTLETSLGSLRFDKKGDATIPFVAMRLWQGGKLVPAP